MIDGGNDTVGESGATRKTRLPVIGWRSVIVWAIAALVTTAATTIGLWFAARSVDTARAAAQLDAIKTGLSIGVGAGGLFALWLATRRQRSTEVGLTQQERTIEATIADADEKRITELYTKAAEQIGHDKAPVRLAGVYALERLAQDNPKHRQTIVNVLCAYLRMPFKDAELTDPRIPEDVPGRVDVITTLEEREIRTTIQRLICDHLQPCRFTPTKPKEEQPKERNPSYWSGINLNLDGALLINLNLRACRIAAASFRHATFAGTTDFRETTFTGDVGFNRAVFHRDASFDGVHFSDFAWFSSVNFRGAVSFNLTRFAGVAGFKVATFLGDARFRGAKFESPALFESAKFRRNAVFERTEFRVGSGFAKTIFDGEARMTRASFGAGTWFRGAQFNAKVDFSRADFQYACFLRATFAQAVKFGRATFRNAAEFTNARFGHNAFFRAAYFQGVAIFDSATFARAAIFDGTRFYEPADFGSADFQTEGQFKGVLFRRPTRLPQGNVDLLGAIVQS